MHSYPRINAPYHEHAHSLYIDTILSYGIVGTILLVLSSVAPVRLMMDMSQESGKTSDYRPLSLFPYSGCCARNLWLGSLLDPVRLHFLASYVQYSIGASNVGIGHDGLSFIRLKSSTLGRRFFYWEKLFLNRNSWQMEWQVLQFIFIRFDIEIKIGGVMKE